MRKYMLLAILMCLICTGAAADMDLAAYEIDAQTIIPVSDGRVLLKIEEDEAAALQMVRGEEILTEIRFDDGERGYSPFVFSDGRTGFLIWENDRISDADYAFCYWGAGQAASNPIRLDERLKSVQVCGCGFAALASQDESRELRIYDEMGRLAVRRPLRQDRLGRMDACAQTEDGYLAAIEYVNTSKPAEINEHLVVERLGRDGSLLWRTEIWEHVGSNTCVCTDGAGGAYVLFAPNENYKVMRVYRIDADGSVRWKKTLEAEGLILDGIAGVYDAGKLLLIGQAVSKSRGVYDVIRLTITEDGEIASSEAWDFSARPDYSFTVKRAADGMLYAFSGENYLSTLGTPAVLVPVADLPEKTPPTMTLQ